MKKKTKKKISRKKYWIIYIITFAITFIFLTCIFFYFYKISNEQTITPTRNETCARFCNGYSVFSENRFDVPYNVNRQIHFVIKESYLDRLNVTSLKLLSCSGLGPQDLNCVYENGKIYYNINNEVCYHYDSIVLSKLTNDKNEVFESDFLNKSTYSNNVYYFSKRSTNYTVTFDEDIKINIKWICD